MAHHPSWIERTLETFVLPAVAPVADVRTAGSLRCECGHTMLAHARGTHACRTCRCVRFHPARPDAA